MPNVIGPWFPQQDRKDDEEFYYASILTLFRPWWHLHNLKNEEQSWKDEGLAFIENATRTQRDMLAGMQYYYDCRSITCNCNQDSDTNDLSVIAYEDGEISNVNKEEFLNEQEVKVFTWNSDGCGLNDVFRKHLK